MELTWKFEFIYTVIRVFLGTLLFFQAYDRVFRVGLEIVVSEIKSGELGSVNSGLLRSATFANTAIELVFGLLIIFGALTEVSLLLVAAHLIVVTIVFSYLKGVWNTSHVVVRLGVSLLLLSWGDYYNKWSVDSLLNL